ncbi:MAG: HEAT repeat domain-containing protein [Candidatus Saganbacteria bacterium]|nr:HEAT repeat domain-containing protein [Candidatus Saganbacteria bacterium]
MVRITRPPGTPSPASAGIYRGVPRLNLGNQGSLCGRVKALLSASQDFAAASWAFERYDNIIDRFAELTELDHKETGRLLFALPLQTRKSIILDLASSLLEKDYAVGEKVAKAILHGEGFDCIEKASSLFLDLISTCRNEREHAAFRKIIFMGLMADLACYAFIYAELLFENQNSPTAEWYDLFDFLASDGQFVPGTPKVNERHNYMERNFKIFENEKVSDEDRMTAVEVLDSLGAVEYFNGIFSFVQSRIWATDSEFDKAILVTLIHIYGRLDPGNPKQLKKMKAFEKFMLKREAALVWMANRGQMLPLERFRKEAVPFLLKMLKSGVVRFRYCVLDALVAIGDVRVVSALAEIVEQNDDADFVRAAGVALENIRAANQNG